MSDFYALAPDEQAARLRSLAAAALGRWGLAAAVLELLKYRENAVFAATTPGGVRHAVRVHRAGYHTDAELRSEHAWMRALDRAGVHTPAIVPARDGRDFHVVSVAGVPEPRQVDMLGWVDGRALGTIEHGVAGDAESVIAVHRTLGELAARVHDASAAWTPPAGFTRHAWDAGGLVGARPFWGPFWELAALSSAQRDLLHAARAIVSERLARFGQAPDRYGLIHADFLPENLLVADDGIHLIDFDDAGFGWHVFELATPLFFQVGEPAWDAVRDAIVAGYRTRRQLPDEHVAMVPTFLLARGFTYLGWVHTRRETDTARALTAFVTERVCEMATRYVAHDGADAW
jgi:Ser/Thr protein kinase RdoA (MazF antagonist)